MRRSLDFLLLLAGLLVFAATAHAQSRSAHWTTYLNVNDLWAFAYDGTRLWIGSGGGAVAFDPWTEETEIFHRTRDGLLSDSLRSVVIAPDGKIWFGTAAAGISIFNPVDQTWEPYTSALNPIPGDRIQRIVLKADTLMVGTDQGFTVQIVGGPRLSCQEGIFSCPLPSYDVRDVVSDPDGNGIWVATAAGVAHRDTVGNGNWTSYTDGPSSPSATRLIRHQGRWICAFPDGVRALGGSISIPPTWDIVGPGLPNGAAIVDLLSDGEALLAAGPRGVWSLRDGGTWSLVGDRAIPARAILRTPDGTLWAAGTDPGELLDGLWKLEGDHWVRRVFPGPSIRSNYIAIAFDPKGTLWVTTARNQTTPMRQSFDGVNWSTPRDLTNWTWDFLFNSESEFWLAQCCCSTCSLQYVQDGVSRAQEPRSLRDLAFDARGNIWAASDNDNLNDALGVWFRDATNGVWTQITPANAPEGTMLSTQVRAILPRDNELWIGYRAHGVHRWNLGPDGRPLTADDGTWSLYSAAADAPTSRRIISNTVNRLAAHGSVVWVGTAAGLSLIDADIDAISNIGPGFDRLPQANVNDVIPLADGGAWVATGSQGRGGGLTRMTPTENGFTYANYGPPDLVYPNVETLALDPDGFAVWMGTNRGISKLVPPAIQGGPAGSLHAYPNPYQPDCRTGIRLQGFDGVADGVVVDLSGRVVQRFSRKSPGAVVWDGRDASGRVLAPGLYWIRISSPGGIRAVGVGIGDGPCQP